MQPFVGGPAHLVFRFRQHFHQAQDFVRLGAFDEFGKFLLGGFRQGIEAGLRVNLGDQDFTHGGDDFREELAHVSSSFRLFMQEVQEGGELLVQNQRQRMGYGFPGRDAEDVKHLLFFNVVSAEGNKLVQHGLRVPHASVRHLGDGKGRFPAQAHSFRRGDVKQVFRNDFRGNGAQVEALAARQDGRQNLVGFRSRKNEFDVGGRLLQRFQQGVEGLLGEHVHFIYIDDAEIAPAGSESHVVPQVTDVVDAAVGCAVYFQDVQAAPFRYFLADVFVRVKVHPGTAAAIQGFCKNSGGRCFSRSAGAYKKVGVGEAVVLNGVFQRLDDMILSKDVIECQRTVFSGKDLVTHGSERLEDESVFEKKIERNCFKMLIRELLRYPVTELP